MNDNNTSNLKQLLEESNQLFIEKSNLRLKTILEKWRDEMQDDERFFEMLEKWQVKVKEEIRKETEDLLSIFDKRA
jgi:hypothetical protein